MDLKETIPQVFFDLIGRVIPGFIILASAVIVLKSAQPIEIVQLKGWLPRWYTGEDVSTLRLIIVLSLISYILAFVLHGIFKAWESMMRHLAKRMGKNLKWMEKRKTLRRGLWTRLRWSLRELGKRKENKIRKKISRQVKESVNSIDPGSTILPDEYEFPRIIIMYDAIRLREANSGARLVKLRAEMRMCRILGIGWFILALANPANFIFGKCNITLAVEVALLVAVAAILRIRGHLLGEYFRSVYNHWILLFSSNVQNQGNAFRIIIT
jgi:hypothetical protein